MATKHHDNVDKQFGEQANAYLTSSVHASGRDLVRLAERLFGASDAKVLDMGCGAGMRALLPLSMSKRSLPTICRKDAGGSARECG